jgi:hypothetical protein
MSAKTRTLEATNSAGLQQEKSKRKMKIENMIMQILQTKRTKK